MSITLSSRAVGLLVLGVLSLGFLVAAHEPANKMNVSASESDEAFVANGDTEVLLSETLKVSNPTDLILGVTAECSILSDLATEGNETAETNGQLKLYVTIDGEPVKVSAADEDEGRVVFCDRTYRRTTMLGLDDGTDRIEDYLGTRSANAFDWVALDAGELDADGDGLLTVVVHAEYDESNIGEGDSEGVVGNRTLIIQPTRAKNDETHGHD